ncbi:MAG: T9SS type A sorting domain-containing protein, partial [Chitinophagaceae bacterium]|nr:T9SS type A sorting domain-containing protein [Chitinophagaceae bacterium]
YTLPNINISVFGVAPHMHLIGRSIRSYAIAPGTPDTLPLIRIPEWNFKWQGAYYFQKVQKVLGNTKLYAEAFYDNTISNPLNPNNPPQTVNAGENTNDEMMLVYFIYTPYVNGDENIILDSTLLSTGLPSPERNPYGLTVYPNPVKDRVFCSWTNHTPGARVQWSLHNTLGQTLEAGSFLVTTVQGQQTIPIQTWPRGIYTLKLQSNKNPWSTLIQKE